MAIGIYFAVQGMSSDSYDFTGDPLHSADPGKYYGFLARAGLY